MIDLDPAVLKEVRGILRDHVPDCEVRIFGSRVNGTAETYSDLDLILVGANRLSSGTLARLKEAFALSDLPILVDVLDWAAISDEFREIIEKRYEVLQ